METALAATSVNAEPLAFSNATDPRTDTPASHSNNTESTPLRPSSTLKALSSSAASYKLKEQQSLQQLSLSDDFLYQQNAAPSEQTGSRDPDPTQRRRPSKLKMSGGNQLNGPSPNQISLSRGATVPQNLSTFGSIRKARAKQLDLPFDQHVSMVAQPAVVHFGGFQLGVTQKFSIRILNKSTVRIRVAIVPPTSSCFQIRQSKKGFFVPGMFEDIQLEFTPTKWSYQHDTIRVKSSFGDSLLIPIHAYPTMNDVIFPRRIHFGACTLVETVTKMVPLRCNVPIDFEYEITCIEPHPYFRVEPLKGIVPGNGSIQIRVSFCPLNVTTCTTTLSVNVAQYGFEPFLCVLTGSGEDLILKEAKSSKKTGPTLQRSQQRSRGMVSSKAKLEQKAQSENAEGPSAEQEPSPANQAEDGRRAKFQQFMNELEKEAEFQKHKELHRFICIGHEAPSDKTISRVIKKRDRDELQEKYGQEQLPAGTYIKNATIIHHQIPDFALIKPTYNSYKNVDWEGKAIPLRRFKLAAQKVVMNIRSNKKKPRSAEIREQVEQRKQAKDAAAKTDSYEIFNLLDAFSSKCTPTPFPLFKSDFQVETKKENIESSLVVPGPNPNFRFMELETIPNYKVLGYKVLPEPDPVEHIQVVISKPFRFVPKDQLSVIRAPNEEEELQFKKQPDSFFHPRPPGLRIFNPLPGVVPLEPLYPYSEESFEYFLNPSVKTDLVEECSYLRNRMDSIRGGDHFLRGMLRSLYDPIGRDAEDEPKTDRLSTDGLFAPEMAKEEDGLDDEKSTDTVNVKPLTELKDGVSKPTMTREFLSNHLPATLLYWNKPKTNPGADDTPENAPLTPKKRGSKMNLTGANSPKLSVKKLNTDKPVQSSKDSRSASPKGSSVKLNDSPTPNLTRARGLSTAKPESPSKLSQSETNDDADAL